MTTDILSGGADCGKGYATPSDKDRVRYYEMYCNKLQVAYGDNIACMHMKLAVLLLSPQPLGG
jgi:chitinase